MERTEQQLQRLRQVFRGKILLDEGLASHTTFRIGGSTDFYVYPKDLEDLTAVSDFCAREGMKRFIIGNGSNILFSDEGFRGLVVDLSSTFTHIKSRENHVTVGAGVPLAKVLKYCIERGFKGLEWCAGIPGLMGGAVRTNAGAQGSEIGEVLESCRILDSLNTLERKSREQMNFSYRNVNLPSDVVIVECILSLGEGNPAEMERLSQAFLKQRKEKQPLSLPSAGSVFKNPPGVAAGKLIEDSGCKGLRIGDAEVSRKHANFIVNCGRASAMDVRRLIDEVRERVDSRFGVKLETEIHLEGFRNE